MSHMNSFLGKKSIIAIANDESVEWLFFAYSGDQMPLLFFRIISTLPTPSLLLPLGLTLFFTLGISVELLNDFSRDHLPRFGVGLVIPGLSVLLSLDGTPIAGVNGILVVLEILRDFGNCLSGGDRDSTTIIELEGNLTWPVMHGTLAPELLPASFRDSQFIASLV